jgi:integrase
VTAKIVTDYLRNRADGAPGIRSPHLKFTLAQLKALPIAGFDYEVRDTEQKGFICRVRKSGVKSLEIYKKPKGTQKPARVHICQLGAMSWKDSRPGADSVESEVLRVLNELRKGFNPNQKARTEQFIKDATEVSLQSALDKYLDAADIKASTRNGYESVIKNHFKHELNGTIASLLERMLLSAHHKRITESKGPVAANNAMRILRAISNYIREEMEDDAGVSPIPSWPIKHRQQSKRFWNKETRRTGWIKPEYLKDWWQTTERLPCEYPGDGDTARDYLQFILLSGLRRREATQLDWADIDFKTESFKIPDTKNSTVLELPCSSQMIKILKRRKELGGDGPFKIEEPKKFVAWVRRESGVHFTIHDLRRSFITYAESLDFGNYTIKALVNHSTANSRDVTEGYLQLSVERLRKPMQRITDYTLQIVKSKNVVKLASKNVSAFDK